ncbi:hypothetical protein C4D60_Mb07t28250 [Musa balbisiana]|uniref:Uncharacterized protein n=1 Tax=Musa balbisiana TaxID=52838 RepID=A0A4S8JIM6_MUSBA|nr:hypothetical protein C4D60_Mb07t28250 [Musa balbisiana]
MISSASPVASPHAAGQVAILFAAGRAAILSAGSRRPRRLPSDLSASSRRLHRHSIRLTPLACGSSLRSCHSSVVFISIDDTHCL